MLFSSTKVFRNLAATEINEAKKIEWVHLCISTPVPPIFDGSYNHLLWQILEKRNCRDLVIGGYFEESFKLAKDSVVPVVQIKVPKNGKILSKLDSLKRRLLKPYKTDQLPILGSEYLRNAVKIIKTLDNPKIMVWGIMKIIPELRRLLPEHFITFAQRHYDYPAINSYYNYCDLVVMQTKGQVKNAFNRMSDLNPFTVVIPNGVELQEFNPQNQLHRKIEREKLQIPNDKFVVLFPSKLAPYKGTNYLIQWIQRCLKELPDIYFLIIGNTHHTLPQRERNLLENIFTNSQNVKWIKGISRTDMKIMYGLSDICLMPSLWREGFSMSSIEAMASGLPIIASNSGCYSEIIKNGYNGILCDTENLYESVYKAIKLLLEKKFLAEEMGKNARVYAEMKLSREKVISNFIATLEGKYELINNDLSFP